MQISKASLRTNKFNYDDKKHEPIVYAVKGKICEEPYKWYHLKELCEYFFAEYNGSTEREMRRIIEIIRTDLRFHTIIITGVKGYKVCENQEELDEYRSVLKSKMETAIDNLEILDVRIQNNKQSQIQFTKYTKPVIESIKDEPLFAHRTLDSWQLSIEL